MAWRSKCRLTGRHRRRCWHSCTPRPVCAGLCRRYQLEKIRSSHCRKRQPGLRSGRSYAYLRVLGEGLHPGAYHRCHWPDLGGYTKTLCQSATFPLASHDERGQQAPVLPSLVSGSLKDTTLALAWLLATGTERWRVHSFPRAQLAGLRAINAMFVAVTGDMLRIRSPTQGTARFEKGAFQWLAVSIGERV